MEIGDLVSKLDGVKQTGQDSYTALCPAHSDASNSLGITLKGDKILLQCFAGCATAEVCAALGIELKDLFLNDSSKPKASTKAQPDDPLTLVELARSKLIPSQFLKDIGVVEYPGGVKIQYRSSAGVLAGRHRLRTHIVAKKGSKWSGTPKDQILLYGSWRLEEMAQQADYIILEEGESDAWTAWYHKVPALGIPGSKLTDKLRLPHVDRFARVYIWREPDKAGQAFAEDLAEKLATLKYQGEAYIIDGQAVGAKDLSELHKKVHGNTEEGAQAFLKALQAAQDEAIQIDLATLPATVKGQQGAGSGSGGGNNTGTAVISSDNLTDIGNADLLIKLHGEDILYCYDWKKWLIWDGTRWRIDGNGAIERLAEGVVRELYIQAANEDDRSERRKIITWAKQTENNSRIKALIERAKNRVPVSPAQLDANPWAFNVQNGTIDLHAGTLNPHSRADYLTKISPVKYDKSASCPTWDKFIERAMAEDEELIKFTQRAIGYAMTGSTREECMFFLYGEGRNGKTKFLEAIEHIMGDYGAWANAESFMDQGKMGNAVRNDLAALAGVRFAPTEETGEGKAMAESLIKKLTGGGQLQARFLYSDFFTFETQFKIFLASNYKPVIKGTDTAIWERIRLIPFTVYIPPEERDPDLINKLVSEAPGILTWAVEGCKEWLRISLKPPAAVQDATENYRTEMDKLADFLTDECVLSDYERTTTKALWAAYEAWGDEQGEKYLLSRQKFKQQLEKKGVKQGRNKHERYWQGVRLLSEQPSFVAENRKNSEENANRVTETSERVMPPKKEEVQQTVGITEFPLKGKI